MTELAMMLVCFGLRGLLVAYVHRAERDLAARYHQDTPAPKEA